MELSYIATTLSSFPLAQILAVCLGLIFGSFFNVCIHRIPQDESFAFSRSKCPKCQALIPGYLNIPIVSYVILRGKCRSCKGTISIQYPLVEATTGLLFLATFETFGWGFKFWAYSVFLSLLLIISVIDLHHQIIPDELSLPGIVVGVLVSLFAHDISWIESLVGLLAGGGIFWAIAFLYEKFTGREGLGGGDVKLLAMIGAWLGLKSIFPVILISSAVGSLVGIAFMLIKRKDFKAAIPFGPFLAISAGLYLFMAPQIQQLLFP
jgi:leader peptidase (prepilin peptidase) / N-methyltransferase